MKKGERLFVRYPKAAAFGVITLTVLAILFFARGTAEITEPGFVSFEGSDSLFAANFVLFDEVEYDVPVVYYGDLPWVQSYPHIEIGWVAEWVGNRGFCLPWEAHQVAKSWQLKKPGYAGWMFWPTTPTTDPSDPRAFMPNSEGSYRNEWYPDPGEARGFLMLSIKQPGKPWNKTASPVRGEKGRCIATASGPVMMGPNYDQDMKIDWSAGRIFNGRTISNQGGHKGTLRIYARRTS
ncbi:MAG: hypothetical protein WCV86_00415 [Patescibacteria group bacterium]|jgi:hypothetical protein